MASTFWCDRWAKLQTQIEAVENAIDLMAAGKSTSYTYETDKTRITYTKAQLGELRLLLNDLLAKAPRYQRMCEGCTPSVGRPF